MIGRVFDVDDIILNVLGGTFGFYLYNILDRLGKKSPKLLRNEYFLDVLAIFAVAGIIAILL